MKAAQQAAAIDRKFLDLVCADLWRRTQVQPEQLKRLLESSQTIWESPCLHRIGGHQERNDLLVGDEVFQESGIRRQMGLDRLGVYLPQPDIASIVGVGDQQAVP